MLYFEACFAGQASVDKGEGAALVARKTVRLSDLSFLAVCLSPSYRNLICTSSLALFSHGITGLSYSGLYRVVVCPQDDC